LTDAELAALGDPPKLFVASDGDSVGVAAATHMVKLAAGTWNALSLFPAQTAARSTSLERAQTT